jgi:drug/metabolite transporter (DMT)-like permease
MLKHHISRKQWMALLTSYCGIVLVFLHDLQGGSNVALGAALVTGSAAAYAAYLLLSGEMVKRLGSIRLVSYAMCVSTVACVGQFFLLRPPLACCNRCRCTACRWSTASCVPSLPCS